MDPVTIAIVVLTLIGLVCAVILAVAFRFFGVKEDPRVEAATALLPGVNCGACGYAGCADYALAIVQKGAPADLCKPGGNAASQGLARLMGLTVAASERQVALVRCGGGDSRARRSSLYNGLADCAAAELVGGAGKDCRYGCLGYGTCSRACPVAAIEITEDLLAVVHPELCIGCGRCVKACPRRLIRMVPETHSIHILCSSQDRAPAVRKACDVGCIACQRCVKIAEGKGIRMEGNLAVVEYSLVLENNDLIEKCPQKTIVRRPGRAAAPAQQQAAS